MKRERVSRHARARRVTSGLVVWSMLVVLTPIAAVVAATSEGLAPSAAAADPVGLSTLAGSGSIGQADGTGTASSFDNLVDLARSPDGAYLYALDNGTDGRPNTIRRITVATGEVSTFATGGLLVSPTTIEVDSSGRVWVSVNGVGTGKGIIRYPADGGSPQVMVSDIVGGYHGGTNDVATRSRSIRTAPTSTSTRRARSPHPSRNARTASTPAPGCPSSCVWRCRRCRRAHRRPRRSEERAGSRAE